MPVDVLLGLQWGDEGKGKLVDVLGNAYDIIARFQGGPNAGHTLVVDGKKTVLHQVPSGIFHPGSVCLIGNGVVLNPVILQEELKILEEAGIQLQERLLLSRRLHLILPTHRLLDKAYEQAMGEHKIGSTLRGIGPTYQDKVARRGVRLGDLQAPNFKARYDQAKAYHLALLGMHGLAPETYAQDLAEWEHLFFESLVPLKQLQCVDTEAYLHQACRDNKRILAEGAQGTLLDVDFGSYPYVTSSNTTAGGACSGLGIAPRHFGKIMGVFKAYCTRVGSGPFATELAGAEAESLRQAGGEYGATTGRPRRVGWLDLPALKYACELNGVDELVMTKADVLSGLAEVPVCTGYQLQGKELQGMPFFADDVVEPIYSVLPGWPSHGAEAEVLPAALEAYIQFIEQAVGVPITYVSLGPDRKTIVQRSVRKLQQ